MKRLISLLFFLCPFGIFSQEFALSHIDGTSSSFHRFAPSQSSGSILVNHQGGLGQKKPVGYPGEKAKTEKLIAKGNDYFDKMWYAGAARVFDIVLEKTEAGHTPALLSKAGDSHYYTGNLEKAYEWYHELYGQHQEEMHGDTYLKYAQSSKGAGKYRRAATLTKILRQKRDEPLNELNTIDPRTWEGSYTVTIKNLGINSRYSDFSPMFHNGSDIVYASAKDTLFLTSRRYRRTNQPFLDLYIAKSKNKEGDLTSPQKFSKKINTKYHEASMAFSPDQKTIYFTRNNYGKRLKMGKNGINHLKIYRSRFTNGAWGKAEELPFNGEDYSTGHPTISPDGTKMYFVSDRPGGFGETDIYVVDIIENGGFSKPKNLGRTINTKDKEMFPYVADNALYFSSNRPMGFGGLDVYRSDGANGGFGIGVNLGKPINSNKDDFSYIVDATGERGYFASNRKGGKGDDDIYSFKYTLNLNAIVGTVENGLTGEVVDKANISLYSDEGKLINEAVSDTAGNYLFKNLGSTTNYTVVAKKKGFVSDSLPVETKENENISITQYLKQLVGEKPIVDLFEPSDVYFDFDSFKISPRSAQELDKLVNALKENESLSLKIASHTDAIGPEAYNKYLSDKRAKSTRDYLVSQGIDPSRIISAIGYGEERLLNDCSNGTPCAPDQHRLNRRSEFILVSG
ncbi:OmpA family protein [Flagellimonas halotolerans]|uniref:OmpA family protein n=1 Tax=Flagellimonas halotolerans TaxID=3112164 RepID=A0ABU6ILA4_9FLAO|nr:MULTISPECIES: OmpA family protein [unclassified Allomuricauda]MEC3963956.1 OmpA family protein [Muricauda sp. SYSU M86414]MEC4263826.1 OmpA family protein [Muricauda sp. SYSU M84420]